MHLGNLHLPESLNLSNTRISDKGLAAIAMHSIRQHLYLLGTHITDAGVEHLMTLKNLDFLNLSGSGVTAAAGLARATRYLTVEYWAMTERCGCCASGFADDGGNDLSPPLVWRIAARTVLTHSLRVLARFERIKVY